MKFQNIVNERYTSSVDETKRSLSVQMPQKLNYILYWLKKNVDLVKNQTCLFMCIIDVFFPF